MVLAVALVIAFQPHATDLQIRLTAMALEWLGIGTVAYGIRETRQLFGRPGLLRLLRDWISRFPRWKRQVILGAGSGSISLSGSGRGYVWTPMDPNAPVESQLKALAQNVERLNERIVHLQNEIDQELRKQSEALHQEQATRAKGDEELHLRLESAETGGLHITFMGLLWLLLGVFLATLSSEIAQWRA